MQIRHTTVVYHSIRAAIWLALFLLIPSLSLGQQGVVDFRFAPAHWQTIICMPDDWLKTMVSDQGALTYDYGPGPYARPLTEISVGMKGVSLRVSRQYLEDPRVPIVTTLSKGDGLTMRQVAFALVPEKPSTLPKDGKNDRVHRLGGLNGCVNWAIPPAGTDPAFRNVAWGNNRPIRYSVQVEPGSKKIVALGVCESYKWGPVTRLLELHVEGAAPLTVDPMKDSTKNRPYVYLFHASDVNGDGRLAVESHASPRSPDPNVILNAFWIFPDGFPVEDGALIRGELSSKAEVYYSCGMEWEQAAPTPRVDAIHATFSGKHGTPLVNVRTRRAMKFTASGELRSEGPFFLFTRPGALSASKTNDGWIIELPEGSREAEIIVVHGASAPDIQPARTSIDKSRDHWLSHPRIPRGRISVPDSGIQFLLDAGIRTMYQVRDVVDGYAQFQPGPSVYRGLWAGDAMLTGVSIVTLGDSSAARGFLEAVLRLQLPSGQIRSLYPSLALPETPAALTACCIYASSFGDRSWLKQQWPHLVKGAEWIGHMHRSTLGDASALHYGLMPPGFVDGGIAGETADYGSVWWAMVSLERLIGAARWLGTEDHVPQWQALLESLATAWKKAAARDMATDRFGNRYLPITMGDTSRTTPQRGQYAFLFPFPYGHFFLQPDSLVQALIRGNLAMLDSTRREGLVAGSGWLADGIWSWLGGIHGIAHDLAGNASRASELLYAFANHATPTGVWVEEQAVKGMGERTTGDESDAEASAVFLYHVRRLVVRERMQNLEFLAGIPDTWLRPGSITELNQVVTEYGPLSLRLAISPDGSHADLRLSPIDGRGSRGTPVIFLENLKQAGFTYADGRALPDRLTGAWGKGLNVQCRRMP